LSIKREVASERFAWFASGGFVERQLWGLLLLAPLFLAVLLLSNSPTRWAIAWISFSSWVCWTFFNVLVGVYFISKQADGQFDRNVRSNLSKENRKG
jgi:hypothetical protein